MLTFGKDRQHAGNTGYDDDPGQWIFLTTALSPTIAGLENRIMSFCATGHGLWGSHK